MYLLPLTRFHTFVAYAKVDDELKALNPKITWRLDIPNQFLGNFTPDALLAMLREDEPFRKRCHVITTVQHEGSPCLVRLPRVALRHSLIPLLNEYYSLERSSKLKEPLAHEILEIHRKVGQVSFTNNDRTDCRLENLREIIPQTPKDFAQ